MAGAMPCTSLDTSRCVCLFLARAPVQEVLHAAQQCCDGRPLTSLASCLELDTHPCSVYTRRVLKAALSSWHVAGDKDSDAAERLHEHLAAALLHAPSEDSRLWMHRRYTLSSGASLWVKASSDCLAAQTGGFVWPCGLELARVALRKPEMFNGHRVLELGAGTGVAALVLATHTATAALLVSDGNADAVVNIEANCKLNDISHSAVADAWHASKVADGAVTTRVFPLHWCDVTPDLATALSPTLVVAADVCYDPEDAPALARALALLLRPRDAMPQPTALILLTQRSEHTVAAFQAAWRAERLEVRDQTAALLSGSNDALDFHHLPRSQQQHGGLVRAFTLEWPLPCGTV
jgi:predicted nicotinamide N-methyase